MDQLLKKFRLSDDKAVAELAKSLYERGSKIGVSGSDKLCLPLIAIELAAQVYLEINSKDQK